VGERQMLPMQTNKTFTIAQVLTMSFWN